VDAVHSRTREVGDCWEWSGEGLLRFPLYVVFFFCNQVFFDYVPSSSTSLLSSVSSDHGKCDVYKLRGPEQELSLQICYEEKDGWLLWWS